MERFFLDLHEGEEVTIDDDGVEWSNFQQARDAAIRAAREIMREQLLDGRLCMQHRIEVRDQRGETVLKLPFKDAVIVTR